MRYLKLSLCLILFSFVTSCVYNTLEETELQKTQTTPTNTVNQKHTVTASGMVFTPSSLTINQGDTVLWDNVAGFHNVNGTQATYPSNPVSFGNSPAAAPWNYSFVFNTPGNYSYVCDVHGISMSGTIIVN